MTCPSCKADCGRKRFRETLAVPHELYETTGDVLKLLENGFDKPGLSSISPAGGRL